MPRTKNPHPGSTDAARAIREQFAAVSKETNRNVYLVFRQASRNVTAPWVANPDLLAGVASIGDVFGQSMKRLVFDVSAWEALGRDFQAIGRDFRFAARETLEEEGQQERLFDPDKLGNGR